MQNQRIFSTILWIYQCCKFAIILKRPCGVDQLVKKEQKYFKFLAITRFEISCESMVMLFRLLYNLLSFTCRPFLLFRMILISISGTGVSSSKYRRNLRSV